MLKKYHSLKPELDWLVKVLEEDSTHGEPLGQDCYKVRIAIASKGRGKSGGARIITYCRVVASDTQVVKLFLLSIYDKSETASIGRDELARLRWETDEE
ncbi:hypothetical protein A0257_16630 [Hymenobacter psoromatis]|nr:hypothetical protein A0257_16630 [Hymenobacter psoromatis]